MSKQSGTVKTLFTPPRHSRYVVILLLTLIIGSGLLLPSRLTAAPLPVLSPEQQAALSPVNALLSSGHLDKAKTAVINLIETARSDDRPLLLGIAFHQLGQILDMQNDYAQAYFAYYRALDIFTEQQQLQYVAYLLSDIGENYRYRGDYQRAFTYLHRAQDLFVSLNDVIGEAKQKMHIGLVYKALGRYENALSLLTSALSILQKNDQTDPVSRCLSHIGEIYVEMGDVDQAERYLLDALAMSKQANALDQTAKMHLKLGKLYLETGQFSDAQQQLTRSIAQFMKLDAPLDAEQANVAMARLEKETGNPEAALQRLNQALLRVINNEQPTLTTSIHIALAETYLYMNDVQTALTHARAALEQAKSRSEWGLQIEALSLMVQAYTANHNYEQALAALQSHVAVQEKIQQEVNQTSLNDLQTEIELSRQAQSIDLLRRERSRSLAEARQANMRRSVMLGGAIVFLLVLFLLWSRVKDRQLAITLRSEVKRQTEELRLKNNQLEDAYRSLEHASLRDPLTGLFNRHYLEAHLPAEIQRCQHAYALNSSSEHTDLICFLIDIDFFKKFNDDFGHLAGDKMLSQFAGIIRQEFRQSDLLIRWGGEEFLVICRHSRREQAEKLAERLLQHVREHRFTLNDNQASRATCSLGFAPLPLNREKPFAHDWQSVFSLADYCLYAAKHSGRDAYVGLVDVDASQHHDAGLPKEVSQHFDIGGAHIVTSLNNLASICWPSQPMEKKRV